MYSLAEINEMSYKELHNLATELDIEGRSKLRKKSDLLTAIIETVRTKNKAERAIGDVDWHFKKFLKCYENGDTPKIVAEKLFDYQNSNFTEKYQVGELRQKTLNEISKFINETGFKVWGSELEDIYKELQKPLMKNKNLQYKEMVINEYGELDKNFTFINGSNLLNWVKETLTLAANRGSVNWLHVSLALALSSGRRMDEIHGKGQYNDRYYDLKNDNVYISQLAKSVKGKDFEFKPLEGTVNSETWLSALKSLPETYRDMEDKDVNRNVSSRASKGLKSVYEKLGIAKYKDSRDVFLAMALKYEYKPEKHGSFSTFCKNRLGHDEKNSGRSYEKFSIQ